QAEDGIRDFHVTGVQTCALPIYARVGLTPDGGGSWFITRSLPRQLATELLMEGKAVGADRLHELGVVNRLVPDDTALDEALRWEIGRASCREREEVGGGAGVSEA